MGKPLLNLILSEPLALVKKLPHFDNLIELHMLLASALYLCIHDSINYNLLQAVKIEFYWCQMLDHF